MKSRSAGEHEPKRVAARTTGEGDAAATGGCHGQPEREPDAERRQRVDPARIEVALVDDARERRSRRQSAIDSQTSSLGPPAIAASAIAASANG